MAHFTINQYLDEVSNAWNSRNNVKLSNVLSLRHAHALSSKLQIPAGTREVERLRLSPLDEVVVAHLRVIWALNVPDYAEAYRCQSALVLTFARMLQSCRDDNWLLKAMFTVCLDLRLLAIQADKHNSSKGFGKSIEALEKAAECLMACFRVCAADNRASNEDTKKWGMMSLVNQLFKVYFGINKLNLCKPLIRAIDSSPLKDRFPVSQQVTYRYYVGRKAMFDSNYKSAGDYLTYAFERCHKQSKRNKRLILIYLVPIKMILGYMPQRNLLEKYDLLQFWDLVQGVQSGDVRRLNVAMQHHQKFFVQCGIYLLLEKLKVIAYRNLFKKVYLLLRTHQIPMDALLCALRMMDIEDIDLAETQCIVANLIYEGKIKGYISHQHQKLVVSKQNPFPPLSSLE
ncbi:PCI domain-containing protein 2 [Thrips palmi]|uniref:PCI domain-containing protein 2 homolog n=1 Tax=Thrips palmi TaxID=161013 RepID=A0A6P8YTI1_THRPL|nr:PCI domain-containing protein 2 [Thrips palmi]